MRSKTKKHTKENKGIQRRKATENIQGQTPKTTKQKCYAAQLDENSK